MKFWIKTAAIAVLLFGAFAFSACDGDGGGGSDGGDDDKYAIGDTGPSGVGIVFYVTDGGLHGLEVAPVDQSTGAAWSNVTDTSIGTTGTAIGTGSANTDAIIGQAGHTGSAAQTCRDYRADEEGDWFLPSSDELDLIYTNLYNIASPVGNLEAAIYWSSSDYLSTAAWYQHFSNGYQSVKNKSDAYRVRAVRSF